MSKVLIILPFLLIGVVCVTPSETVKKKTFCHTPENMQQVQIFYDKEIQFGYSCRSTCSMYFQDMPISGAVVHIASPGSYKFFSSDDVNSPGEQINFEIYVNGECKIVSVGHDISRDKQLLKGEGISKEMVAFEKIGDTERQKLEQAKHLEIYIPSERGTGDVRLGCIDPCTFHLDGRPIESGTHLNGLSQGEHELEMKMQRGVYFRYLVTVDSNGKYRMDLVDPVESKSGCDSPMMFSGKCRYGT